MNLFDELKADHREAKGLFTIISVQKGSNWEVIQELCEKLKLHMRLEEQYFYPALEEYQETASLAKESYREHSEAKELIKVILSENLEEDDLREKLEMLEMAIDHHVREEENDIFPKAKRVLSDEEIEEIGNDIATKKAEMLNV
jgi:hemerythrin-like domain-containing protein